jgi:O-antigen/teichoic acid export membrane protein
LGAIILAKPFLTAWVGIAYAPYAGLVLVLVIASLFDTLMWPAVSILQGMARHRLLAVSAIISGLVNLAISIALVKPLGLIGVALGTLIPTSLECLLFVTPYSMRVIGINLRSALMEIYLPVIGPAIMMSVVLLGLRYLLEPTTLISILAIGSLGLLVYVSIYLSIGASTQERTNFIELVRSTVQAIRLRIRQKRSDVD